MSARSTADNAGLLSVGAGVSIIANVALTVFLARHLAPDEFGLFGIGLLVTQFGATLFLQAIEPATNRVVALARSRDIGSAVAFARFAARWAAASGSVLCTIVVVAAEPIARFVFEKPQAVAVLRLMAPAILGVALTTVAGGAGLGLGTARRKAILDQALRPLAVLAAVVIAVETGHGLAGAAGGYSLGQLLIGLVALAGFPKLSVTGTAITADQQRWRREFARVSGTLAATAIVMFAASRIDLFIVARLMPLRSVGVYNFVRQLLIPGVVAMGAIGQAIGMKVPRLENERRFDELATLLRRASFWTASLAVPVFGAVAVLGSRFLLLVDARYTISMVTVVALAFGQALNATSGPVGRVLILSGHPEYNLFNNATVAAVGLLLNIVLIPRAGILGAALAAALSVVLQNALMVGQIWKLYQIGPFSREQLSPWLATTAGCAAVLAVQAAAKSWADGFVLTTLMYSTVTGLLLLWLMPDMELAQARAYLAQQLEALRRAR